MGSDESNKAFPFTVETSLEVVYSVHETEAAAVAFAAERNLRERHPRCRAHVRRTEDTLRGPTVARQVLWLRENGGRSMRTTSGSVVLASGLVDA